MRKEESLENRIFKIILCITIIASSICIIGNIIIKFPFSINIKWIVLIVTSSFCLKKISLPKNNINQLRLVFFLSIILILIPFGWIDSGGSNNNTIAYVFLLLICLVYFFQGKSRHALVLLLILVFTSLYCLEHFYPQVISVHSETSQFYDRLIQIPLTLSFGYLLLKQFADVYQKEKEVLDQYSRELEYLATKDTLTGVYNRRYFDTELSKIIQNIKEDQPVFLILFDIDYFKRINDNYGHVFGDEVIRHIAQAADKNIPKESFISRWGGDEFAILFKGSFVELEKYIQELKIKIASIEDEIKITVSVGVTEIDKNEKTDQILKRADQALYKSKENGKNQVTFF